MSPFPRYAIYYVPGPDSALYRFGADLLGYDAFTGQHREPPIGPSEGVVDWPALTAEPRKYGFHATLKAPFALADGRSESDLVAALDAFVAVPREIPVIAPVVSMIGDFIAIVPARPPQALSRLADDCVTLFEPFRAPMTTEERTRRLQSPLTPRQIAHVDRWGYPYVFEDFRFHMTLTGRAPAAVRDDTLSFLRAHFDRLSISRIAVDALGLLRQLSADRRFEVIANGHLRQVS